MNPSFCSNFFLIFIGIIFLQSCTRKSVSQCHDLKFVNLYVEFFLEEQLIKGRSDLDFISDCDELISIDLDSSLKVDSLKYNKKKIDYKFHDNKIQIKKPDFKANNFSISVYYHGFPQKAINAPWDGGVVWSEDSYGNHWAGVACQMNGSSLWWPSINDHNDEPDGALLSFVVDTPYTVVSNGHLKKIEKQNKKKIFRWEVNNPINSYNVTFNIANFFYFSDLFEGVNGNLKLDYYVLPENSEAAKNHFKQVKPMLSIFENLFGPYPFYSDGYKLVETPYLGMEHQSCISYGNKYLDGYLGKHPIGIDFDFIIIHETAHEWWGNSVSMKKKSEMWIHESFATYSEALYVEKKYGYEKMIEYLKYQKKNINNNHPMIKYNNKKDTDVYYKGSWMLHTLRSVINNDSEWFELLKNIQLDFKHAILDSETLINYINSNFEIDLVPIFEHYLTRKNIPKLQYKINFIDNVEVLSYRWRNVNKKFNMPIKLGINGKDIWIEPKYEWKNIILNRPSSKITTFDALFLIEYEILN